MKMAGIKENLDSIIYSGSDMNHKTFADDESWNSLQSTILAGQFSVDDKVNDSAKNENLTTVHEEDSLLGEPYIENELLNMNIDAINEDVFHSPMPWNIKTPIKKNALTPKNLVENEEFQIVHMIPSQIYSTGDSGLAEEKTGELLVEMIENFQNDMKDHAQSTPKDTTFYKSGYGSASISQSQNLSDGYKTNNVKSTNLTKDVKENLTNVIVINDKERLNSTKRKLDFPETTIEKKLFIDKKENLPIVSQVNSQSKLLMDIKKSRSKILRPKVREMKEFFENASKSSSQQSRIEIEKKTSMSKEIHSKSMQFKLSYSKNSSTFCNQETWKLLKNSKTSKLYSSKHSSPVLRNQSIKNITSRSQRPSSCSEFSSQSSSSNVLIVSNLPTNKSKSTGDLIVQTSKLDMAAKRNLITRRSYCLPNQRSTLHKSPKNDQKISKIMSRKSFGYVSTPVKPVQELRKIFSPAHVQANAKQIKKASGKSSKTLPRIVIHRD